MFYNEENSRDLAVLAVTEDSVYDVYGEIDYDEIDYSYEDDETLNATEYDRATFSARIDGMLFGNTLKKSTGYGKYNLRPGKNLTAFIKFAYDFYKNNSGEVRVGCKIADDLVAHGLISERICPMEELESYAGRSYISADNADDVDLKRIWKDCTEKWEYEGTVLSNTENIFEHLQDLFMCYVYLKPGVDKIRSTIGLDISELSDSDYGAILSMMYERFGGRPINPSKVETGNAIANIGTGDILGALVDLSDTSLSSMDMVDKIYTYMIEVKYKNNDLKLASWLEEAKEMIGSYNILSATEYDEYMKAYQKAFQQYGQDAANDTLLDYGCVLTPEIFESRTSFNEALNKFANTIRSHFGNSSFYRNRDNANYVAKSYVMAKKICENSQFSDITDIYACDMDVVSHTVGYDSSNIILLADTQVVELDDSYGEVCDTDQDGILDYREAHTPEEVDITNFLIEYCKYNKYTPEETADMLAKNSKVVMYNYSSNPVLPDSDFDGRSDLRDGRKLDNEYNSINETNNYRDIRIKFNQDYRYFFMDSTQYYEELAEMGLILSNMASVGASSASSKKWTNNNVGETYTANNIDEYMYYLGMEHRINHMNENVPYMLGQHDTIALLGKVSNLERNVITLVIGENENYKDILVANYDGSLGAGSGDDIHHQGYDYHAQQIYEQLVNYDNSQTAEGWKKSYWITGYGTGGSIANLVAKKFIDYKHVNTNVYCYTYQAPHTINKSNLTRKIQNTKYHSIFNIENMDDILLNLSVEESDWTKYGVIKKLSVGDDKDARTAWKKLVNNSSEYKGGSKYLQSLKEGILGNVYLAILTERIRSKNLLIYDLLYGIVGQNAYSDGVKVNNKSKVAQKQAEDVVSDISIIISQYLITEAPLIIVNPEEEKVKKEKYIKILNDLKSYYVDNIYTYLAHNNGTFGRIERASNTNLTNRTEHLQEFVDSNDGYVMSTHTKGTRNYDVVKNSSNNEVVEAERWHSFNDNAQRGYYDYGDDNTVQLGDDCSSFIGMLLYLAMDKPDGFDPYVITSSALMDAPLKTTLSNYFEIYDNEQLKGMKLEEGDILVKSGHATVYIDETHQFGWGNVQGSKTQEANWTYNSNNINESKIGYNYTRLIRFKVN